MQKDGITIGKIPGGQRKVKADFKKIMEAVVKSGLMAATGNWFSAAKEFTSVISAVQLKKEPAQIAYYFILEALVNTAHHLMAENQWRLRRDIIDPENLIGSKEYVQFLDRITDVLDEEEIVLGPSFLHDPKSLEILPPFQQYFKEALLLFGTPANEAEQIANRLPSYFVFELNDIWRKNTNDYAELLKKLETPFSHAVEKELQWQAYQAFLDWQIDQPVFEEAFSLRDIFIPLRAYYEDKGKEATRFGHAEAEEKTGKRRVVWLEESLDKWLQYKKPQDEIKMMSGGPGSGKSSFAKMWAAKVAHQQEWQVIFIPLHLFDIHGNIIDALGKYLISTPSIPFTYNPLENPQPNEKFLVIFDGLDELVMQGKTARDSAADFIDALEKLCHRFNTGDTTLLKILIAGRPISVQNADSRLRGTKQQVIYLLPYFLTKNEIEKYEDTEKLLATDQRETWWHQYQKLKNLPGNNMPEKLQNKNLDNLTREPLLNYLISLSWSFAPEKFGQDTNINEIYYILMHGVYKRDYEGGRINKNIGHLGEDQFFQILEEIAVCAWHGGDVRVTSERKIEKHIADRGLKPLLEEYKESVKGGVSRLLTAFYFRKYGRDESSEHKDETFEFTHKSFGEYLTARALVELVKQIYFERKDHKNNTDHRRTKGWTKQHALSEWLRVTGASLFDKDLKTLVQNEIRLRANQKKPEPIRKWQLMLCELIAEVSETGMPFFGERLDHKTERLLSQNAEIALLVLLESCALVTEKTSPIEWVNADSFWNWLHGLYSQFNQLMIIQTSLSYIEVKNADLQEAHLQWVNLQYANLKNADLELANLRNTKLQGANLLKVDLLGANLQEANLRGANLQGAILEDANLFNANLQNAGLQDAGLQNANLQNAGLQNANLFNAYLFNANLFNAYLQDADLQEAHFRNANFRNADLRNADLRNADLQDADLQDADLQDADLYNARGLTFNQLSQTKTLYRCTGIPKEIQKRLEKECPHLFEKPKD